MDNNFKLLVTPKAVTSKQFSWDWKDLAKSLLLAVATPALLVIQQSLEAGSLAINWREVAMVSIAAGVAYLVKNFFQKSTVVVNNEDAENAREVIK